MPRRSQPAISRPRRGAPEQTRERLIAAASIQFNRFGFHETDSNTIAREAGYAAGTFYKHFRDKREVFLVVYERWLAAQWNEITEELSRQQAPEETAKRIVELSVKFHTEWRGLRASLMELVFCDCEARKFFEKQRRRQLELMSELRHRLNLPPQAAEEDAIHLFMTERVFDAIGQGEIQSLGLDKNAVLESMTARVYALLKGHH
jgi:AcrR family transcriptional regulator